MRQVRFSLRAAAKLKTLCEFYAEIDVELGDRARHTVVNTLDKLIEHPGIGRPYPDRPKFRERIIRFGASHFLALYFLDVQSGDIIIVGLRHEREMGYGEQVSF